MKYKQVSKERCSRLFELYRKKNRQKHVSLSAFCSLHKVSYWVMRRWMRDNNETVRQARTGIPARQKVRMPDMGIGFCSVDMEGDILYRLVFRILPFEVVEHIGNMLISLDVCSSCQIQSKTDTYRRDYVAERVELTASGYMKEYSGEDLARLCREVSFAKGYELYILPINELINLKVKTAFAKRKRYI